MYCKTLAYCKSLACCNNKTLDVLLRPYISYVRGKGEKMLTTAQLLDLAKSKNECSDYKLAKLLGVVPSAVTNYRSGRSHPDARVSASLAELCGLDAAQVTVWIQVERSRDDQSRAIWNLIASRLEKVPAALAAVIFSVLFSGGPDAGAQASTLPSKLAPTNISELTAYTSWQFKLRLIARLLNLRCRQLARWVMQTPQHFDALPFFA